MPTTAMQGDKTGCGYTWMGGPQPALPKPAQRLSVRSHFAAMATESTWRAYDSAMRNSQLLTAVVLMSIAVGGCGPQRGDGGPSVVDRGDSARDARVVATLGDSIVAGSPLWDPDPDVRAGLSSPDADSQWQRWVESDSEFRNCGVWGERTDEIAARFSECTRGADAVVIQGGINDIVQGRDVEDAARNLACVAQRARSEGLAIALVEVLPWNNGYPDAAPAIRELNQLIHALGERADVPVLEFFEVLEDEDSPDRMPDHLTDDGDHPNVAGYRLLGEQSWIEPVLASSDFATNCAS